MSAERLRARRPGFRSGRGKLTDIGFRTDDAGRERKPRRTCLPQPRHRFCHARGIAQRGGHHGNRKPRGQQHCDHPRFPRARGPASDHHEDAVRGAHDIDLAHSADPSKARLRQPGMQRLPQQRMGPKVPGADGRHARLGNRRCQRHVGARMRTSQQGYHHGRTPVTRTTRGQVRKDRGQVVSVTLQVSRPDQDTRTGPARRSRDSRADVLTGRTRRAWNR